MKPTLAKLGVYLKRQPKHLKERRLPTLWLMTDDVRLPEPERSVCAMPRGTGVIVRSLSPGRRAALAEALAPICKTRGLTLLVAGDWRLAARINAAGVHLGEKDARRGLAPGGRLWRRQRGRVLTVAAHGASGLARAKRLGATAAVLAPIFATKSHPDRAPLGPVRAAALTRRAGIGVIGLGGITPARYRSIDKSGFSGIAGIGFVTNLVKS